MSSTVSSILDPQQGSRFALISFALLSALFLWSFGPFNSVLQSEQLEWKALVLAVCVGALVGAAGLAWISGKLGALRGPVGMLSLLLVVLMFLVTLTHAAALSRTPGYTWVNVAGTTVTSWRWWNWNAAVLYLYVPVLLPLLYLVLRKVPFVWIARILAIAVLPSIAVLYYQVFVDSEFLNRWLLGSGRYGGLATDPNAYGITAFLLTPILVVAAIVERDRLWRVIVSVAAGLLASGIAFAGSRTGMGGLALLVIASPAIYATAQRRTKRRMRAVLFAAPLVLLLGTVIGLQFLADNPGVLGVAGTRLGSTWEKVSAGGPQALIFDKELRGILWTLGWASFLRAPLGGWGPAGSMREFPNDAFLEMGEIRPFFDCIGNHYLMIAADFGLPTLIVYVVLLGLSLYLAARALLDTDDFRRRLVIATLIVSQTVFLVLIVAAPPWFADASWAWALNLALLVAFGERARVNIGAKIGDTNPGAAPFLSAALAVVVLVGAVHTSFGTKGYQARLASEELIPFQYERNCYAEEQWPEGRVRWCGNDARLKLPIPPWNSDGLRIAVSARNPDLLKRPLDVAYSINNGFQKELTLSQATWTELTLRTNLIHTGELPMTVNANSRPFALLSLAVARSWNPKDTVASEDRRELGIAVRLRPERPLYRGFYDVWYDPERRSIRYWRGNCKDADTSERFFLHIYPANDQRLRMKKNPFNSIEFWFKERGHRVGGACDVEQILPKFPITKLVTGQYDYGGTRLRSWQAHIESDFSAR